jgi:peptidyl-tRNA hydrolase, PTH1 family
MKLLVGLGNPGDKYARNRHNIGFMALDRIADRHRFSAWRRRFQGETAEGDIGGVKTLLLKPTTYMNESGRAVAEAARFLKIEAADVIALHDELDLAPGAIKAKTGGGNAGHNGLKSMTAHIGPDFVRVRLGIGHPGHKDAVAAYVLHDFAKADGVWLVPLLDAVANATPRLIAGSTGDFLSDVSRELKSADGGGRSRSASTADSAAHREPAPAPARSGRHPAGERMGKRQSALAENLKRFLAKRRGDPTEP